MYSYWSSDSWLLGYATIGAAMIVLSLIIYLVLLLYLMITLRKQLLLLVNNNKNGSDTSSMWYLMKRFTILAVVSCSVALLLPILLAISNIITPLIYGDYSESNLIITSIGWMIMYNNDILCIILQFGSCDQIYNCLCSKCPQLGLCTLKTMSNNMEMSVTTDAKQ